MVGIKSTEQKIEWGIWYFKLNTGLFSKDDFSQGAVNIRWWWNTRSYYCMVFVYSKWLLWFEKSLQPCFYTWINERRNQSTVEALNNKAQINAIIVE